jgi:hypothetical protein
MAAVGESCEDLHGRGLWAAADAELLEAVWQFRRTFQAATEGKQSEVVSLANSIGSGNDSRPPDLFSRLDGRQLTWVHYTLPVAILSANGQSSVGAGAALPVCDGRTSLSMQVQLCPCSSSHLTWGNVVVA